MEPQSEHEQNNNWLHLSSSPASSFCRLSQHCEFYHRYSNQNHGAILILSPITQSPKGNESPTLIASPPKHSQHPCPSRPSFLEFWRETLLVWADPLCRVNPSSIPLSQWIFQDINQLWSDKHHNKFQHVQNEVKLLKMVYKALPFLTPTIILHSHPTFQPYLTFLNLPCYSTLPAPSNGKSFLPFSFFLFLVFKSFGCEQLIITIGNNWQYPQLFRNSWKVRKI